MLPSIDAQQWRELAHYRVLICIRADEHLSSLIILYKPRPAAPLDTGQSGVEFRFEGGEVAVGAFNGGLFKSSVSSLTQTLFPEKRYVRIIPSISLPAHHLHHSYSVPDSPKTSCD